MSVILEFRLLSSSVCVHAPTYTSLCRGLKYLLTFMYIILVDPNGAGFLISRPFFWAGRQHCPMSAKIHHKNERNLRLVSYIDTKLSHNVYLINTHILIDRLARCDCKVWNALWFYWVFFWVFSNIFDDYSCLNFCISAKLSHIVSLSDVHIMVCQHAKFACSLWKVLWLYFKSY